MDSRPDRRRYFRINDMVGLSYGLCSENAVLEVKKEVGNVQIAAAQVLESIDNELTKALSALWKTNPAAANVINLVSKKIDIIAAEVDLDYAQIKGLKEGSVSVNISACGISFHCKERLNFGQKLDLFISLKPGGTNIRVMGTVVGCEQAEQDNERPYLLRVDFDSISRSVQEELIQHIVRRQSNQLGLSRQEDE